MLLTVCCAKSAGFQSETGGLCWGSCGSLREGNLLTEGSTDRLQLIQMWPAMGRWRGNVIGPQSSTEDR